MFTRVDGVLTVAAERGAGRTRERQPAIPAEAAAESGLDERYVTEWLRGQAAGGYVAYDASAWRPRRR